MVIIQSHPIKMLLTFNFIISVAAGGNVERDKYDRIGETRPEGIKLESSINHKPRVHHGSELCRKGGKLQTFNRSQAGKMNVILRQEPHPGCNPPPAGIGSSAPLKEKMDGWMDGHSVKGRTTFVRHSSGLMLSSPLCLLLCYFVESFDFPLP